jgi:BCD family chlorophyll transporter-like MFS transporter
MNAVSADGRGLPWFTICRLGLVQAALGAVVVLVTSTLNRVMVVEYALPATLPGALVSLHYAIQIIRPRFGHGSDVGGRRTPWIVGGLIALFGGCVGCALATPLIAGEPALGVPLAIAAYALVGLGVGAAGTSLLVLLAQRVDATRRAAAATIMWVLMIFGFAVTSTLVGRFLDPYSPRRLGVVIVTAAAIAIGLALIAIWRVEPDTPGAGARGAPARGAVAHDAVGSRSPAAFSFGVALRQVWQEPRARAFTLFVFVSMLSFSAQELLLEPFAGLVFGLTVGSSAKLSGLQHAGVLLGMISVGLACSGPVRFGTLRAWTLAGCLASALALLTLAAADWVGPAWPLRASVFALGVGNGVFSVAAIGSMMELAHEGRAGRAGVRMGLWGAAQALAFGLGGVFGTSIVDLVRLLFGSPVLAFGVVFSAEAALFLLAAVYAAQINSLSQRGGPANSTAVPI